MDETAGVSHAALSQIRTPVRATTLAILGALLAATIWSAVPTAARQDPPRPTAAQDPAQAATPAPPPLAIQITSPLGRTGMAGALRIVARVAAKDDDAVLERGAVLR